MFQSDVHSATLLARQRQAELHQAADSRRARRPDQVAPSGAQLYATPVPVMHAWLQAVSGQRVSEAA
jgi:hypothetical protein